MFLHDTRHVPSYYAASCDVAPPRPALQERLEVDVAIVGAGFTGLYTAIRLARAGKKGGHRGSQPGRLGGIGTQWRATHSGLFLRHAAI